jgi:hypothetical protein
MVIAGNRKPKWFFYPGWVVLSAISIPVAWVIAWALISQVEKVVGGTIQVGGQTRITEDLLSSYVFFPALGLVVGCLQYLLLRRHLPRMGWWIVATMVGWLLPFAVLRLGFATLSAALDANSMWSVAGVIVLIGGCIGLAQWLVLRQRVRHAAWWVPANVLGWGMAILVGGDTISSLLDVLAFGLLPPTTASIALWLLLDKLPQREGSGPNPPPDPSLEATAPTGAD